MSLCPPGHAVPGQHELHEAKSLELRLVSQEGMFRNGEEMKYILFLTVLQQEQ